MREGYEAALGPELRGVKGGCFLKVGYTEKDDGFNEFITGATSNYTGIDGYIVPVTLNYKYERVLSGPLNMYVGAGAGAAFVDADVSSSGPSNSFDDTVFYGYIFAGLTYNVSPAFEVYAGARYIFMDGPELTGFSFVDDQFDLDGDVLIKLGARYNF